MTVDLNLKTGTKLLYQTRYESQDPKFHGPRRGGERAISYRLADRMRTERYHGDTPEASPGPSFTRPLKRPPRISGIWTFHPRIAISKRSLSAQESIAVSA
jgi:hypothetical protein